MALHLGVLIVYSLGLVAFGLIVSRRGQGRGSFFVANRSFGSGMVFSTFLAANIGAGSVIAASELGYEVGLSAWWYVGSAGIGQIIFAFVVAPRIWRAGKEHGLYTAGDYLELRYGNAVRATVVSILWLGTLAILAAQLIAMSQILLPFMVLPLYASVEKIDWSLAEAASDLGADRLQVFRHSLLPQIMPGLIAGVILVFLPAMGQFVIPDLLGGAKTAMLGNVIQQQFGSSRDWPFGSAISLVALLLVMAGLWIYLRRGDRGAEVL